MTTARTTADWYRSFADEARGQSAIFEGWAEAVAQDAAVLARLDELPLQKRQPNLVFAVARLLGAPEGDYAGLRAWLLAHWAEVAREALHRRTQTNEPRRCAALLPALAAIPGPLALLELGASAGLCLYPDRYSYRYGEPEPEPEQATQAQVQWRHPAAGTSTVVLDTEIGRMPPLPEALPEVMWRAGIDLDPLDVRDPDAVTWLETLVWPEQTDRLARIRAAIELVRADPPLLVRGDALEHLPALAAAASTAAPNATLVVVTPAMLVYVPYLERMRLVEAIRALDARWVSLDAVGVLPEVDAQLDNPEPGSFTLSLDGRPLAAVGPHGQYVHWLGDGGGTDSSASTGNRG